MLLRPILQAPANGSVPESVSLRKHDSHSSPHAPYHNANSDDDDDDNDEDSTGDSYKGDVRSPSVSSGSDSSDSASKPGMCFCGCFLYTAFMAKGNQRLNVC